MARLFSTLCFKQELYSATGMVRLHMSKKEADFFETIRQHDSSKSTFGRAFDKGTSLCTFVLGEDFETSHLHQELTNFGAGYDQDLEFDFLASGKCYNKGKKVKYHKSRPV